MSAEDPTDLTALDDEAWAALAAALPPVRPRPIARARLLRATAGRDRLPPPVREAMRALFGLSDEDAGALIDRVNTASAWLPGPLPGISILPLTPADLPRGPLPDGPTRLLVRIEPGLPFPAHEHLGDEAMLVLEGALTTDAGEVVGPGMCAHSAPGTRHALQIHDGSDCIAAVRLGGGIRLV